MILYIESSIYIYHTIYIMILYMYHNIYIYICVCVCFGLYLYNRKNVLVLGISSKPILWEETSRRIARVNLGVAGVHPPKSAGGSKWKCRLLVDD